MVFFSSRPGLTSPNLSPPFERRDSGFVHSTSNVQSIIEDGNQYGTYKRKLMRWKTPNLGWVKMFLNPNQFSISEGKDIQSTRTKAGFVLQYAGERLTELRISGTTGSAGIEGINILRTIYRSEQIAFDRIALELERTAPVAEALALSAGLLTTDNSNYQNNAITLADVSEVALNFFNQPFPTLASLAANVELYFQGELFRGYFTEFSVDESAERPGIFEYNITFIAHSRQGIRRNFMPWHRQPYNPIGLAGQDPNPHTFNNGEYLNTAAVANRLADIAANLLPRLTVSQQGSTPSSFSKRNTAFATGGAGKSLTDLNLEDLQ